MKLSDLVRRMRRERNLSQAELARRARVSQASLSYYERDRARPSAEVLRRLEHALVLRPGELADRVEDEQRKGTDVTTASAQILGEQRTRLLEGFAALPERHAILDRPAGEVSGDLAVVMDLRSHLLFAVLDGIGTGTVAALSSLLAASAMIGALSVDGGIVWPHELVRATDALRRTLRTDDRLVEGFVGLLDRRHRELSYCRTSFPVPYLRTQERLSRLKGAEEELGFCSSGKVKLGAQALLLVATDGLAHLATKASRTYWDTPELKSAVQHARTPSDLVTQLEARAATDYGGQGSRDDILALALSL